MPFSLCQIDQSFYQLHNREMHLCHVIFVLAIGATALGQEVDKAGTYVSAVDDNLTIHKMSVLPVLDNVDGIYARPFEAELTSLIQKNHHWDFVASQLAGPVVSPIDLENDPTQVMTIGKTTGTDALFSSKISKGPDGISITLDLFLTFDGKLFAQESIQKISNFDTKNIQTQARELFQKITAKVPYQGLVLSRTGNRVTVSIGKRDGVVKDQVLSVVQIIKATRHPKFNFIISTDKEILGKVKLLKVEDTLSFGDIITERERGAIRKNTKISGVEFINYGATTTKNSLEDETGNLDSPGSKLAFGNNPKEWVPVKTPSFGLVSLALGIGNYNMNTNVSQAPYNYTATAPLYLNIRLFSELWLSPNWSVEGLIRQGILSTPNPRADSAPSNLNIATNKYAVSLGYNFLIKEDFFGPKIELLVGFSQFNSSIDNSTPPAFTSTSYRGLTGGIRGVFPIDNEKIFKLGAEMDMMLFPDMKETPVTSGGSTSNTVSTFSLFGSKKIGQRLEAIGILDFEFYKTDFTGQGTRSTPSGPETASTTSQRITTLYAGVNYLF